MAASTKDPDLVNKITFLHYLLFCIEMRIYVVMVIATKLNAFKANFMTIYKMMFSAFAFTLLNVALCHKETPLVPPCIQHRIDTIMSKPKWNPAAQVDEYLYNGKTVYAFNSDCCDQYNPLYDGFCNYICAPSGGFTGMGNGKCPDFKTTAKHIRLVWKDPR